MVPASDSTGFTQLSSDKTVIAGWFTDLPPFVTSTPPQPPYSLFLETPMQTFSTQVPYDATQGAVQDTYLLLQHASDSLYALPQNASFDNSIRAAQRNESSGMDLSNVGFTWSSMVVPAVSQSIPSPSPIPILVPRWVKVPQRVYEHGEKQWDFKRSEPILFSVNSLPGINMGNALRKQFTGLDGRDDPMFRNAAKAISCRFLFPGYQSRSAQIPTLGWAKDRVPITRSKLAYEVAKQLNRYLESMTGHAMDGSIDQQWKIGEGFMRLENMYLVRLVSVSTGSFQPEIWILPP